MANDGTMIYVDTSTSPYRGASIDDVQTVLGMSSYSDIGGIIVNGSINPWALYKPACANVKNMITRTDFASFGFGTSSRAVSLPYATSVSGLISLYADGDSNNLYGTTRANGWRYLKPRGKSQSEWYRFFDFVKVISENSTMHPVSGVGYNHQAKNPFGDFNCTTSVSRYGGSFSASQTGRPVPSGGVPEYDITIGDINYYLSQKMLYYGVLLVPDPFTSSGAACKVLFNNSTTINDDNTGNIHGGETLALSSIILNDTTWPEQDYLAYPFLTNMAIDSNARVIDITYANRNNNITNNSPRLFPLPGSAPIPVNIYSTLLVINVYTVGQVNSRLGRLEGKIYITIKNNSSSTVNVPRLEMQFRTGGATFSTARRSGEVFYDGQYRYDDNNPTGTSDNSYSSVLRKSGGYDVPGNGGEIRILPGEGANISVTLPSSDTGWIIIGDPTRPNVYGGAQFIMPVIPL